MSASTRAPAGARIRPNVPPAHASMMASAMSCRTILPPEAPSDARTGQFTSPVEGAQQQQTRDVCARDEEHAERRSPEHNQLIPPVAKEIISEWFND